MANILAIDDDRAILDMIGNILKKDGHTVTKVNHPLELDLKSCDRYD